MSSYGRIIGSPQVKLLLAVNKQMNCASHIPQKAWLWQSLCTVGGQESVDGEMGTGSVSNPGVFTLKTSTLILRAGISVSMSMAIIYSCSVPHELQLEYLYL
ncbi:hypothetical protein AVEN_42126-1 [Araneus ventricosus]|uniref:Uncharacterized protein n=1 Tax=Araneus ventricosus TaxID=182803 RepID=A0A4Y2D282_ARAVE|nr:hypothetical protein AVEN_42126-1 [Araneus ventricosus]